MGYLSLRSRTWRGVVLFVAGVLVWWSSFFLIRTTRCSKNQKSIDLLDYLDKPEAAKFGHAKGREVISPIAFIQKRADSIPKLAGSGVPMVFHQTIASRDDVLPLFLQWAASWLRCHPDFIHVLWDDCDIDEFVRKESPEFWKIFKSYAVQVQRADMFRYFVLRSVGGVYMVSDIFFG